MQAAEFQLRGSVPAVSTFRPDTSYSSGSLRGPVHFHSEDQESGRGGEKLLEHLANGLYTS